MAYTLNYPPLKKVITLDGSETFLNESVNEMYHSTKGAIEEALIKYAGPCKIRELARAGKVTILDVCSGMGYNGAVAIDVALEENPDCEIEVVGLEYDPEIIKMIQNVNPEIKCYAFFKQLNLNNLIYHEKNITIKFILGDARETCKLLSDNYFDAIFFDPFSPKSSSEMWCEPFFKEMYRIMKSTAVLATFSCARLARDNMSKAGLFWNDGPVLGRRGPGTLATKWI